MKLLLTLSLIFLQHCCFATTYYISPNGSDVNGNGSAGNPWQSLFHATSAVTAAGSIIHVNAGVYTERAQCILAAGVSIEGEGVSSIIQSTLQSDWTAIIAAQSAEGTDGNQHIANLKLDGQHLSTFWAIVINGRSNFSIHDCTILDFKDRGVIFDGRNDNKAAPPDLFATGNSFYNNTVTNCAAYNTPNGVYGRGCLNIGGQDGMLIHDNIITQDSRPNGYNGWPIKYSNDGYLKRCKIYNNVLTKIPYGGTYGGENGWDFAIEFWNVLGEVEIYGNTIQGSVDLANTFKSTFKYSVWFHDNKVQQKQLNHNYESGVIFEATTESAIVENNVFNKIAGGVLFNAQENTILDDIIIRKNIFTDIGRNIGNGNNGSAVNFNCGTLLGNTNHYSLNKLVIADNTMIAAASNAPYYGIEITGSAFANNIKILHNSIKNFRVGCIIANEAAVIDSMVIENNTLSGNGNSNNPFYISGRPGNYIFRNNIKGNAATGSNPGFNFREQLVRPLYYEVKRAGLLELIAFITLIISILFGRRENIYMFPMALIGIGAYTFLFAEQGYLSAILIGLYFTGMCIYGYTVWRKRDRKGHRIVRITSSSKKTWIIQWAVFALSFIVLFAGMLFYKNQFAEDTLAWADACITAAAFTGAWLLTRKKAEAWYWLGAAAIGGMAAYYFYKHYVLTSAYYGALLMMCLFAGYRWNKRKNRVKRRI